MQFKTALRTVVEDERAHREWAHRLLQDQINEHYREVCALEEALWGPWDSPDPMNRVRLGGVLSRLARLESLHTPKCAACGAEQAIPEQHPAPALTWTLADGEKAAASCCDQDCNRHPQSQNQSHTKEKTP